MANEKKKILLVDDDEMHLATAELILKDAYEIHRMKSGQEALEYVLNNEFVPDIMLFDIVMPEMDGWELLKRIRKMGSLKDIPVVFLTAVVDKAETQRAQKMGVADYITKPFNMVELKTRINKVLEGYRMKVEKKP